MNSGLLSDSLKKTLDPWKSCRYLGAIFVAYGLFGCSGKWIAGGCFGYHFDLVLPSSQSRKKLSGKVEKLSPLGFLPLFLYQFHAYFLYYCFS